MRRRINITLGITCCLFLIFSCGCAITSELICGPIETEILSDPDGAKIEINNEYMGTTPLKVTLERECDWYSYHRARKPIVIKAEPVKSGQFTQYKIIRKTDLIPRRIVFHMYKQISIPETQK
ncbi:MAG: PEGA domain-containing protein [Candidatus Omnitrophica bacterium]|nr:PEGA domain-containing protein [Candidatus Omnitrophota bacterium]